MKTKFNFAHIAAVALLSLSIISCGENRNPLEKSITEDLDEKEIEIITERYPDFEKIYKHIRRIGKGIEKDEQRKIEYEGVTYKSMYDYNKFRERKGKEIEELIKEVREKYLAEREQYMPKVDSFYQCLLKDKEEMSLGDKVKIDIFKARYYLSWFQLKLKFTIEEKNLKKSKIYCYLVPKEGKLDIIKEAGFPEWMTGKTEFYRVGSEKEIETWMTVSGKTSIPEDFENYYDFIKDNYTLRTFVAKDNPIYYTKHSLYFIQSNKPNYIFFDYAESKEEFIESVIKNEIDEDFESYNYVLDTKIRIETKKRYTKEAKLFDISLLWLW